MPRPPLAIGTYGRINSVRRAPGAWVAYARFRDVDGVTRQIERTGPTSAKAENLLKEAMRDRQLVDDSITADSRIADVAAAWFEDEIAGQRAEQTVDIYQGTLRRVVIPSTGNVRVREFTVAHADRLLKLITKTRGAGTAKTTKTVLSGVLGYAAKKGALSSNPLRDVSRIKKPAAEPVRVLDLQQLWELRAGLYADRLAVLRDLVEPIDFMLATGGRIGEVLAIRWFDLELDGERPYTRLRATIVKGKVQEKPKSESSRRKLYLPPWAVDMLRERRATVRPNDHQLVFASDRGTPRDPSNVRRQWREARAALGFEWVKPHTFRKSIATLMDDLELARKQLGHADTRTTEKHYIPHIFEGPQEAAGVLQQIGEPALTQRSQDDISVTSGKNRAPESA